jgi:hypothetical protein
MAVDTVTDERVDPRLCNQAIPTVGIEARVAFGAEELPPAAEVFDLVPRRRWRIG